MMTSDRSGGAGGAGVDLVVDDVAVGCPSLRLVSCVVSTARADCSFAFSSARKTTSSASWRDRATPRAGVLLRIDPTTNALTRIRVPQLPTGVAIDGNDVWVTVRKR